jgi:gamma-D-glutamyl-L-lysine dipeptidyl-peptidase
MKYAVCIVPVAHVRLTANHRAEMVTQLIFGESIKCLEIDPEGWIHAECLYDNYKGFCRQNQFVLLDQPIEEMQRYTGSWVEKITWDDLPMMIPFGSNLSILTAGLPGVKMEYSGAVIEARKAEINEASINAIARLFLNTAYIWGSKSVFGIDCSGYAQSVFKMLNIVLPRDANMQVHCGEAVGFLQEARCGDLAFFDEAGAITHVGILLNDHEIIHASGNVRIDKIDSQGIINTSTGLRTHQLRTIRRVITTL